MTEDKMDVAQILTQLKQEIREQYRDRRIAIALSRTTALKEVHDTSWVNFHRPIAWPHWPEGLWTKSVALVQKIVRRCLRWYINPIVKDQNRFNAAVVKALDVLAQENIQLQTDLQEITSSQSVSPVGDSVT